MEFFSNDKEFFLKIINEKVVYIKFNIYLCNVKTIELITITERRCKDEMTEEKRLILRILALLDIMEYSQNQSLIGEIRGLLHELLNSK